MTPNGCILQSVLLSKILQRAQGTNPIQTSESVRMPAQKKKYRNPPIEFPGPKPRSTTAITPQFLDIKQVATYLSATVASARRWVDKHELRWVKIGRRRTYNRDDINAVWLKQAA
jgi:excisionase family DNA binding protein